MKTLEAGRNTFKQASCSSVDRKLDGKLVHVSCDLTGTRRLGATVQGLKDISDKDMVGIELTATTEVFAWRESSRTETKQNSVGGGETKVTTYTYDRVWTTSPQSTQNFYRNGAECRKFNNNNPCVNPVGFSSSLQLGLSLSLSLSLSVCVCVCVCVCTYACFRACLRAGLRACANGRSTRTCVHAYAAW